MSIKERIRALCADNGTSLPKLEAALGFGNSTISKWDTASPTLAKLEAVAQYFNVPVSAIIGEQSAEKPLPVNDKSMDITLERILSLIPKKPDGKYVHGAKKVFAESIGLSSGNLIADWVDGRSSSYKSYLYEISAKYNVSVEWLKGETDEKKPLPVGEELDASLVKLLMELSPDEAVKAKAYIQGMIANRK